MLNRLNLTLLIISGTNLFAPQTPQTVHFNKNFVEQIVPHRMQVRIWELEQEIETTLNSLDIEDLLTQKQNLEIAKLHELRETLESLKQTYQRFIEKQKQQDS